MVSGWALCAPWSPPPSPTCRPVSRGRFQSHTLPAIHGPLTFGPFTYPHSDAPASRASRPLRAQQTAAVHTPSRGRRERTLVWPEAVEMAEWRRLASCSHRNCARTSISLRSSEIRPGAAGVPLRGAVGNTPDSSPRQPLGLPTLSSARQASGAWCVPPCPSLTGCSRSTSQINYLHSTPASALHGGKPRAHHASHGPQ